MKKYLSFLAVFFFISLCFPIPLVYALPVVIDSFDDTSKISSSYQIDVWGSQAQLENDTITLGLEGWKYVKKIVVDHNDIDTDLADFPVLVYLNSSYIDWGKIQPDLDDLRFVCCDNVTILSYEIEQLIWAGGNSEAWVWVKIPDIYADVNTEFFMYYNNPLAEKGEDPENVWDANFVMVQHMNDATTSTILDSTSNNNDGTKKGVNEPIETALGQIDDAQDFDGVNDYILVSHSTSLNITGNVTVLAWINPASITGGHRIMGKMIDSPTTEGYRVYQTTDKIQFLISKAGVTYSVTSTATVSIGSWYHIAGVYDGVNMKVYVNAVEKVGVVYAGAVGTNTDSFRIGSYIPAMLEYFKGTIDEIRISTIARSPAWIKASYESERLDLLTFSDEQQEVTTYSEEGNFQSINLLSGLNVTEIQSFIYNCSIEGAETMSFQFSQNLITWYNATDLDEWVNAINGLHTINLKPLGWRGGFFYYRCNMTDFWTTPELYSISVSYSTEIPVSSGFISLVFIFAIIALIFGILSIFKKDT